MGDAIMSDNISIIGGADGPTSVFVAGKLGMNWLNTFGLVLVILLLIPNIIYAVRVKNQKNKCTNKFMNILEQIGRYGCMFLMIFNIGIVESGFPSINAFIIYLVGNTVLMLSYWIIWMLYFNKQTYREQMALAVIPTSIFLLSGITMLHYFLIIFAVIFGIGHIYVTSRNKVC